MWEDKMYVSSIMKRRMNKSDICANRKSPTFYLFIVLQVVFSRTREDDLWITLYIHSCLMNAKYLLKVFLSKWYVESPVCVYVCVSRYSV